MTTNSSKVRVGFGIAILLTALFFVTLVVWGTWESGDYFRRTYPAVPYRGYPFASVVGSCTVVIAEAYVLWRALADSLSITRALAASGASLGAAAVLFFTFMMPDHVPARVTYHFLWLLSAAVISTGTVLTLAAAHLARIAVGRREVSNREDPLQVSGDIVNTPRSGK